MGSFKGHVLPGCLFLLAGMWWSVKSSFLYITRRNKSHRSTRLANKATQRHLEIIEGSVVLVFSVVGILAEQFAANGPSFHLHDNTGQHWEFLMNWQHSTMYMFFGLAGAMSLIVHTTDAAPLALDRLMIAIAFFNEGFLFLYHLHGRLMLDVHVHQLLLFAIFGEALTAFLEVFHRGNIMLELLRCTLTLLQGSWFWQISFVLYPLNGPKWDLEDHSNVMFITMCFCWHLAVALLIVSITYGTVRCAVHSRLQKTPPMEMGLLKPREQEHESEDEIL